MPRLLYLLTLCNLTIGTGAFVINGILGAVSTSLGVSIAVAGQAMTVYALSTALLGPMALLLIGRWPRRRALVSAMALFGAGNLLCALAPSLPVLFAGRALMGVGASFTAMSSAPAPVEARTKRIRANSRSPCCIAFNPSRSNDSTD